METLKRFAEWFGKDNLTFTLKWSILMIVAAVCIYALMPKKEKSKYYSSPTEQALKGIVW